jgi:arginase family enzyme
VVDAIDSGLFQLAGYPHSARLVFEEEVMSEMRVFLASEKVVGMVVTEVNPNNDSDRRRDQ